MGVVLVLALPVLALLIAVGAWWTIALLTLAVVFGILEARSEPPRRRRLDPKAEGERSAEEMCRQERAYRATYGLAADAGARCLEAGLWRQDTLVRELGPGAPQKPPREAT